MLTSLFVVCCLLLFDSTLQGWGPAACSWAFWCFLTGLLFATYSCLPRDCNVGLMHPQLNLLLHCFAVDSP
jgi:hypothetical protein